MGDSLYVNFGIMISIKKARPRDFRSSFLLFQIIGREISLCISWGFGPWFSWFGRSDLVGNLSKKF